MSKQLDGALLMARLGFRVFPLEPGTKKGGLYKGWQNDAMRDPKQIAHVWSQKPYNVAVVTDDALLIDVDRKDGKDGYAALADLGDLPPTFEVETPTGGRHIYLRPDHPVTNSRGRIGEGIDIRGYHGFAIGPGSVTEAGEYRQFNPLDEPARDQVAQAPAEVMERVKRVRSRTGTETATIGEQDTPAAIAAAVHFLRNEPGAVQGEDGAVKTIYVAHEVRDFGITEPTCFELIAEYYNPKCSPPWDLAIESGADSLQTRIASAYAAAETKAGCRNPARAFTAFDIDTSADVPRDPVDDAHDIFGDLDTVTHRAGIPPRKWIMTNTILRGQMTVLVAPGGVGKSQLTIAQAIALATGDGEFWGFDVCDGPQTVLMVNNEDDHDEIFRRTFAACKVAGVNLDDVQGRIKTYRPTTDKRLRVFVREGRNLVKGPDFAILEAYIVRQNIDVVFLDPWAKLHLASENDNSEVSYMMDELGGLAKRTCAALYLVHHTSKGEAAAGEIERSRGAKGLTDGARLGLTLWEMTPREQETFGVSDAERMRHVRLDDGKANYNVRSAEARWFRRKSVRLPGDTKETAPALVPVDMSDVADGAIQAQAVHLLTVLRDNSDGVSIAVAAGHLIDDPLFSYLSGEGAKRAIVSGFSSPVVCDGFAIQIEDTARGRKLIAREQ